MLAARYNFWDFEGVAASDNLVFQVDFASPKELLENEKGFLPALVDEIAVADSLYDMVHKKSG